MNRTSIDFGIDLGTTNSALALLNGVATEIIKNNRDNDITPSAVHISKKGDLDIGFGAKQRILQWPDDTFIEFKRRMGTDHVYVFESTGQRRKAEELSAEVLKSLKSDAQQKTGELPEAAVITVPAAFELHQCDATRRAAELAGFKQSPLLQEPVAAALAHGFQIEKDRAYWLVYDFGGGTFDAAVIKAEEGTIHVVNHGGDNFLGGSDLDWALIEKIIAPRIVKEFGLEQFDRAHAGKGGRWRQAFARLKFAAEQAKIELSRKDRVSLDPDFAGNLKDEAKGEIVVEEVDLEITRAELIHTAEPFILRSVEIAQRVLKEKNLDKSALEKVILVGGPTLAPYFREMLASHLGIPMDHSVDPLTVVARGAAIFAGTQRLNMGARATVPVGQFAIDFKHKPVGMDSAPIVGGKITGSGTENFTGFIIELVNSKTQWRSGKVSLRADGVFVVNLHAERGERNDFSVELFDPAGRRQQTVPENLSYTIGAVVEEQPLINSMGIALANNTYDRLFEKGRGLPLKATRDYRTTHPIHQGRKDEVFRIPVIEGEVERADRNRLNAALEIRGDAIQRDLPAGSEVEVTLKMDESRIVTVLAYVPLLDEEFSVKVDMQRHKPDPDELAADLQAEIKRFREVKLKAAGAGDATVQAIAEDLERSPLLQEVKDAVAAAKGDPDAAAKGEKRLLELKIRLDEAADALEWPALVAEAHHWLADLDETARNHGTPLQRNRSAELADDVRVIVAERKLDRLRSKMDQARRLYFEILFTQPAFWVDQFQYLEKQKENMTDPARAARLLEQGRDCLAKNNSTGLQNVVRQIWDLIPKALLDAAQRGYRSGIIR